jgi:hypothetical protein
MNNTLDYIRIDDDLLISLYSKQKITVDRLPYTKDFDFMFNNVRKYCPKDTTQRDLWLNLVRLRKSRKLTRLDKP